MYWQDKLVTILGLGKSGLACAETLARLGARLCLSDKRPTEELLPLVAHLPQDRLRVEGGGHSGACLDADALVLSPGVSIDLPMVQAAIADGVPVIGEIELAYQLRHDVPYVAITGTNGKTTTTTLTGEILAHAGKQAPVGGNIGTPLVSLISEPADAFVLEVSSFQLETIHTFRPHVAVFLNFSDDHLDRHGSREGYWAMKKRLFENQEATDIAVLNADDPAVASLADTVRARPLRFSQHLDLDDGVLVQDGWIVARDADGDRPVMPLSEIRLRGTHNLENVLAAVAVAVALALPLDRVREAVAAFSGVEHRIEPVTTIDGVLYLNDSKGTNYASTVKAIEAFDEPIVLIAGGRDKGGAISDMVEAISRRVRHTVLIGEAAPYFERVLRAAGYEAISRADDLQGAVAQAQGLARAGEVVLFSPACTSFDMFKNYEERGRAYKSLVHALAGSPAEQPH
ncbi:MAG: UDP-N-acetylmuramoyl-L-alanine--D-glutamate ligase [Candidatus Sericytochromatia bacterium]